jgi:hypothetical protein
MCRKTTCRVRSSVMAPETPPRIDASEMIGSRSRRISPRNVASEVSWPGQSATVLVALASTGGTPSASIAGNEINDPPPAIAFMIPARKDATTSQANCQCELNPKVILF